MKFLNIFLLSFLFIIGCGDPCDDVACANGSTCDDGTCLCVDGYEGTLCDTEVRTKFLGTYSGTFTCDDGESLDASFVVSEGEGINDLIITTPDIIDEPFMTTLTGNTFSISQTESEPLLGLEITINIDGTFTNDQLVINLSTSVLGEMVLCSSTMDKQ